MYHIAVVEDDKMYAAQLKEYLKQYEKEKKQKISVTMFSDGEDIVTDYSADFDIILMDIEMKFLDGMSAAERIREKDSEVIIIFITNMPQYAIQGYRVDALDYVLKPLSYFAFSQRIDRALSRIRKNDVRFVVIPLKGGRRKVDVSLLCYVEVRDHDLIYHTAGGSLVSHGTMRETEQLLRPYGFFRVHHGYLVNLYHVREVRGDIVAVGGAEIRISRAKKEAFLRIFSQFQNAV